jgi:hypothetical protein
MWQSNRGTPLRLNSVLKWQLKPILKKLGITFSTKNGMHAFRHGRISYLAYSGVTFAVIREWVGHGSDAMIKHYMARWQANNAAEMAKLQPVVRPLRAQNHEIDGNKVALGTRWNQIERKGGWHKSRVVLYNEVLTMGRSPVAQW